MTAWLPVPGYEGDYQVSDEGQVCSFRRGAGARILRPGSNGQGHRYVNLKRDGTIRKAYVHRLVLEAFVGPCPPGMEARHFDGHPENNALSNLRWGTRVEQREDDRRTGAMGYGERARHARLTDDDVLDIQERLGLGESATSLASEYAVTPITIRRVRSGRTWSHITREREKA